MATTPPPQSTIPVPPSPRHGAGYDSYGRLSTRRSERLAGQGSGQGRYGSPGLGSPRLRVKERSPVDGSSQQHSQSEEDDDDGTLAITGSPKRSAQRKKRGITQSANSDEQVLPRSRNTKDQQHLPSVSETASTSTLTSSQLAQGNFESSNQQTNLTAGMLPTPVKTPRKKAVVDAGPESRTLFSSRSRTHHSQEPAPSKMKGKTFPHFSLESFNSDPKQDNPPPFTVFTDSRDRIPEVNESVDNPFLSKPTEMETPTDGAADPIKKRRKVESTDGKRDPAVDEAVQRDDGMLYVFRGKKIFRKFEPDSDVEESSSDLGQSTSQTETLDRSTPSHVRPLTRSSIKPRVLFPTAGKSASSLSNEDTVDETTNDEERNDQNTNSQTEEAHPTDTADDVDKPQPVTPQSKSIRAATPPSPLGSARSLRSQIRKHDAETQVTPFAPEESEPKRYSPFDRWRRTKKPATPTKSKKRNATVAEASGGREVKKLRGE